jgi:hypothetical protein
VLGRVSTASANLSAKGEVMQLLTNSETNDIYFLIAGFERSPGQRVKWKAGEGREKYQDRSV